MPFSARYGVRTGAAGCGGRALKTDFMISAVYYIFLVFLCTFFMVLSAVALVVCYPFDKGRRVVHELSRILVRIFFAVPPRWRQRVIGREYVDRKKSYVIVLNHNTVIDIPTLYYIPLNFRWVSKREVFKTPFFGQYLVLHGDICINRGRASEALEQMVRAPRTARFTVSRRGPSRWPRRRAWRFFPWCSTVRRRSSKRTRCSTGATGSRSGCCPPSPPGGSPRPRRTN